MRQGDKSFTTEEIMDLLRRQKHDYLNHIQVIYSYLQIGKPDRALDYMKKIIPEIEKLEIAAYIFKREVE